MVRRVDVSSDGFWRGHLRAMPAPMFEEHALQGRNYMHDGHKRLLDIITKNFETAYKNYLVGENLEDNDTNKIAFYTMVELVVRRDPIPEEEVQSGLLEWLDKVRFDCARDKLDMVDHLVIEASHADAKARKFI